MCGVAGFYAYSPLAGPVDRDELRAVREHMASRGPDGAGDWFSDDGRVGLAHRRLAIIDLGPGGAQPKLHGHLAISFNGEIYNYRELRAGLQQQGRVFRTESDTEVILQLYEAHGTAMLGMLRGMFAFALWDARERSLLLARDAFGIKPMYYADDGRVLRAASQVKALLRAQVDTTPDAAGHAGFFLWGSVPAPHTLYRGIRCLPAGHFVQVRESRLEGPQAFCVVADVLAQAAARPAQGSESEALARVRDALRDSVRAHLVSDVPVGVFLSSGLDSAMLAAMVAREGAQLRTLTLGFAEYAGTPDDEAPLAQKLARQLGAHHDVAIVGRGDFESERDRLLAAMDQPSIDGVNTWFVARAAAARGIKVALSGLGGDELFGSYPSFRQVPLLHRVMNPFARIPGVGLAVRHLSEPLVRAFTSPKYAGLIEFGGTLGGAYLLRRGLYMPWELPRVMDPDLARDGWRELQSIARLEDTHRGIAGRPRNRLAVSALEMSWYMRHQLLADADWAGMAHSVEIRLPFVDVPLLRETAPWFAAHPAIGKGQVARAAAPDLASEWLNRPKTGFSVPVRDWLGATAPSSRGLRGWAGRVHGAHAPPAPPARPRVLISTLAPGNGGVSVMAQFVVDQLRARGMQPVLAYYAPYSQVPELSVPSYKILRGRTGHRRSLAYGRYEAHAIGAWLPELEFTHYHATPHWRKLMDTCDAFVAVSGNVLAATPFQQTGRPYLAWVATDWHGDRKDRVKGFPLVRRWLDRFVNAPVIRRLERLLLQSGRILSLSEHTAGELRRVAGGQLATDLLPVAVESERFAPKPGATVQGRLGFSGRFGDPRKNITLLLQALARLRAQGLDVHAVLMGDSESPALAREIQALGLAGHVVFRPGLSRDALRDCIQTLDVFVLPSHQEGLCISALEAMACAVPVVSTRCGGPEEFVRPGATGELVGFDAAGMAEAIGRIVKDRVMRDGMGLAARRLVEDRYTRARVEAAFARAFDGAFPGLAGAHAVYHPAPPPEVPRAPWKLEAR